MLESNSRANVAFFFILLVAQLVPGQTRFLPARFFNTRAYIYICNLPNRLASKTLGYGQNSLLINTRTKEAVASKIVNICAWSIVPDICISTRHLCLLDVI